MDTCWTQFFKDTLMKPHSATLQRQRARLHKFDGGPDTNPLNIMSVIDYSKPLYLIGLFFNIVLDVTNKL